MMYCLLHIEGGIGKSIMATAVAEAISKFYPERKLIVTTAWPEIFLHNPHVHRVYKLGNIAYFYNDYIQGKDTKIFRLDPYQTEDFVYKRKHLIQIWCDLIGVPYNNEPPRLFFTYREEEYVANKFIYDKPLMLIQTNGGAHNQAYPVSWARDIPLGAAQQVVDALESKYKILHIRRDNQPALNRVDRVDLSIRELALLIKNSSKRLFIDSFAQHAAAALGKRSTVCWIANTPAVFGYNTHDNIVPSCDKDFRHHIDSYLDTEDWTGTRLHECPYDLSRVFDPNQLIKSIESQTW